MNDVRKKLLMAKCGIILLLILSKGMCFAVEQATISVVFSSNIEPYRQSYEGFKTFFDEKKVALRVFEHNMEETNAEAINSRIKEQNPDLIFAIGSKALLSAQKTNDIPVVFSMVLNPELIAASNITGVSLNIPPETKLENIKRILPEKKNIGLIYSPQSELLHSNIQQACDDLNYQLVSKKIDSKKDFPEVLQNISQQIDCFMMTPDTEIYFPKSVEYLLRESLKGKFPVIGLSSTYVKAGALIAFDCDYEDMGKQAGELAYGILSGQQIDGHFISPRKVKLSLNLLTAKILGINISQETINQASEVFGK